MCPECDYSFSRELRELRESSGLATFSFTCIYIYELCVHMRSNQPDEMTCCHCAFIHFFCVEMYKYDLGTADHSAFGRFKLVCFISSTVGVQAPDNRFESHRNKGVKSIQILIADLVLYDAFKMDLEGAEGFVEGSTYFLQRRCFLFLIFCILRFFICILWGFVNSVSL